MFTVKRHPHQRFLEKVKVCAHGPTCTACCWPWEGCHSTRLHGKFFLRYVRRAGKRRSVHMCSHVYMWLVAYGRLPKRGCVKQACGTLDCNNPAHLVATRPLTDSVATALQMERLFGSLLLARRQEVA